MVNPSVGSSCGRRSNAVSRASNRASAASDRASAASSRARRAQAQARAAVPGLARAILAGAVLAGAVLTGTLAASAAQAGHQARSAAGGNAGAPSTEPANGRAVAWVAQTQVANDEGSLHLVGESGADLIEEGQMTGTFPGRAKLWFTIGATVNARFTLYPHSGGGSISGSGSGKLRSSGRYASFGGTMSVSSGTGRYSHVHGTGGFYGTILRKAPYPVVVQTRGTLTF